MWKIEKYIVDNKGRFEESGPVEGHEQRFMMRLDKQDGSKTNRHRWGLWLKAAASVLLIVSFVWLTLEPFKDGRASSVINITSIEIPADLQQVISYYDDQSQQVEDQISKSGNENGSASTINQAATKQIEKLDARLLSIEKEYMKNPGSEAVKAAMVNTQRKKTEILNSLNKEARTASQGYRVGEPYTKF
ncbi:MAG: hypothetical protein Q8O72_06220 [Bacteroidales bacterium]|nr:hypothetical protein [Bacteroidales bacterium]